jgi:hypothetical protein
MRVSRSERFVPLTNCPTSDDAARDEWIDSNEFLGCASACEHAHRSARRLIGERPDHEQPAVAVKRLPERAMGTEVRWNLGQEIGRSFVEEHVFHFPHVDAKGKMQRKDSIVLTHFAQRRERPSVLSKESRRRARPRYSSWAV